MKDPNLPKIIFRWQRPQEGSSKDMSIGRTEGTSPHALGTRLGAKQAGGFLPKPRCFQQGEEGRRTSLITQKAEISEARAPRVILQPPVAP